VQQFGPSALSLKENLISLVDVRVYDRFPVGALHTGNANWGAVAFACGAPALVGWMREDARLRKIVLGFLMSTLSIFALVTLDAWNMRFILFFPALPAIAAARAAAAHRVFLGLVSVAALLCFVSSLRPVELSPSRGMFHESWRKRSARPGDPPVSEHEPVGAAGEELTGVYWLYNPDFSRRVIYLRESTSAALLDRLQREEIRVLYVSPRASESPVFQEAVSAGRLEAFADALGRGFRRIR
jgi:hypothetical protein